MIICGQCGTSLPIAGRFCAECGARLDDTAVAGAGRRAFERRHVHVMFTDLIGSTEIAAQLDPEELMEVITGYQTSVSSVVMRFGGRVVRYVGDGILIYFGWPIAQEDAAECAIRCGCEAVEAVGRLALAGKALAMRVGIASGHVVAGHGLLGDTALGAVPNLASRLQGLAGPNEIVMDAPTQAAVSELFELRSLGPQTLKGYAQPIEAWCLGGRPAPPTHGRIRRDRTILPLIGRQAELEMLLDRWGDVLAGTGGVVEVRGEAGIGKSRLLAAIKEAVGRRGNRCLELYASAYHRDTPLYPVACLLEQLAGIRAADADETRLEKVLTLLAPLATAPDDAATLAYMLSLMGDPGHDAYRPGEPQRIKERSFSVLLALLAHFCAEQPVLLLVEDAHWLDRSTRELLDLLVQRLPTLPMLVVQARRSADRGVPLAGTDLALASLDAGEAASLVAAACPGLSGKTIGRVVRRSNGVPLFLVEIARASSVAESDPGDASKTSPIPSTLQASLLMRLDRLPEGKQVAQIGAVIGREFTQSLLETVAEIDRSALARGIEQLLNGGIIISRATPEGGAFQFYHPLVHEALYDSVLFGRRRELHTRLVAKLQEPVETRTRVSMCLLGHHCAQAGLIEQAADYYRRAGESAAERAALAETRGHLELGIELLGRLPDSLKRQALEVELELAFGRVLLAIRGNADAEAGFLFRSAFEKCRAMDSVEPAIRALWGLWFNEAHRWSFIEAEALANEMLLLANTRHSEAAEAVGRAMLGIVRLWQGRYKDAHAALEASYDLCLRGVGNDLDVAIVGRHMTDHVALQLSLTLTCLGYPEDAMALIAPAEERARRRRSLPSRAIVLAIRCRHAYFTRNDIALHAAATELAAMSEEQGYPFYLALGRCHLGWLAAKDGCLADGFDLLQRGLNSLSEIGAVLWEPLFSSMMAEARIWSGQTDVALRLIDAALATGEKSGAHWLSAELHRLRGEALVGSQAGCEAAETHFRTAIALSRLQFARLWELRSVASLVKLLAAADRGAEAAAVLGSAAARNDVVAPAHRQSTLSLHDRLARPDG
jgi:class 3 adenylate cyclase/tetratricopeptide (TPR) repeat protein